MLQHCLGHALVERRCGWAAIRAVLSRQRGGGLRSNTKLTDTVVSAW